MCSLHIFVQAYQAAVQEGITLMQRRGFPRATYASEWMDYAQANGMGQKGYVDEEQRIGYFLHGIGCMLNLSAGTIDWDFGHDGRIDGFDMWRLWTFAHIRSHQFPDLPDQERFEQMFAEAQQQGKVRQSFREQSDYLFYWCETRQSMDV